jgi:hypothetical protein
MQSLKVSFISDAFSKKEVEHLAAEIVVSGYKHYIRGFDVSTLENNIISFHASDAI